MKNSKTIVKPRRTSSKATKRIVKTEEFFPAEIEKEDKIRELAWEIYNKRAETGEPGSAMEDWLKAEQIIFDMIF